MGGVGDEDLFAGFTFTSGLVVGADHEEAGHLAVCACKRSEADGLGACNLGEEVLEAVHDGEGTLDGLNGLERVNLGKAREAGDLLVPLGVVLHGATAEGVETAINPEVQLAQASEISDQVKLTELRYVQIPAQKVILREGGGGYVEGGESRAPCAGGVEVFKGGSPGLGVGGFGHG